MSVLARLQMEAFDPARELAELLGTSQGDGAVVSFVGTARPQSKRGVAIDRMILEHHHRLTAQSLEQIAAAAAAQFEVSHVRVVHRHGEILPGEAVVFAGACSVHRRAAFDAADYLMDRLKTDAVFWKREEGPGGASWIEPTDADYAARERWKRT